jgi:GNAT superfamily N-acetyltransferase
MPTEFGGLRIEQFDPARHDRAGFACGVDRLDNYLKLSAKKQQKDDMTRVYVVIEDGQVIILGYHAINLGIMNADELTRRPRGAPDHGELPILFLGQVAVSISAQGQGIGSVLMHHVFEKACRIADQGGCFAILLDVMSDGGEEAFKRRQGWYADFGFQPFASNPARMFMTMKQVRAIVGEPAAAG